MLLLPGSSLAFAELLVMRAERSVIARRHALASTACLLGLRLRDLRAGEAAAIGKTVIATSGLVA
jgi:hypothetical protein